MYVLKCTYLTEAGKYMTKSNRGWVSWGTIREAKFFNSPEELVDYLVTDQSLVRNYETEKESVLSWINEIGVIIFHHPLNIPE